MLDSRHCGEGHGMLEWLCSVQLEKQQLVAEWRSLGLGQRPSWQDQKGKDQRDRGK